MKDCGKPTNEFLNNKNIDFEGEEKKNSELGRKGEDIVIDYEKTTLKQKGREDLANKVCSTRDIGGNAERFDVLSYDEFGNEKYIEVKTTTGRLNSLFHISEKEVEFSHQYKDKYYLYRVYYLNAKTMSAYIAIKQGPIDREMLKSVEYVCRISEK